MTGRVGEPRWVPVVALVLGTILLVLAHPSLRSRNAVATRDHVDSYLRLHQYERELGADHWPQVLPDALHGGGHAFPRFYPPLSQFAPVAVDLIVGDVVLATHLAALLTVVLSGIGMFVLVRRVGDRTLPAFLAMMAYSMMPYRFMVFNVRGAYAEAWVFVWYPLVLLGVWQAIRNHRFPAWWPLALAGLLCSHVALSLWAVPAFLAVVLLVPEGRTLRTLLRPGAIAATLGALAAAFYLLPLWHYLPTVRAADPAVLSATAESVASYRANVASSVLAVEILLVVVALVVLVRVRRGQDHLARLAAACVLAHAAFVGLTRAPESVWRVVPDQLLYIQFPWRLKGPAIFFGAAALGFAGARGLSRPTGYLMGTLAAVLAVVGNLGGRAGRPEKVVPTAQVKPFLRDAIAYRGVHGMTIQGEYLPRGTAPLQLAAAIQASRDSLESTNPGGWDRVDSEIRVRLRLDEPQEVTLPLVAYDFYRVSSANGPPPSTGAREGRLTVTLGPGTHDLRITRRLPSIVLAGFAISLVALGLIALVPMIRTGSGKTSE